MKRNDAQMALLQVKGSPFQGTGIKTRFNESILVKLFALEDKYRYVGNREIFEKYDELTGLWNGVDETKLVVQVLDFVLDTGAQEGVEGIGFAYNTSKAERLVRLLKSEVYVDKVQPCEQLFIHVRNGVLVFDKAKGYFVLQDFSPDFNSHNRIDIVYNKDAECPLFLEQLLDNMFPVKDCLHTFQQFVGQCVLKNNISQTLAILSGDAECGKSTTISIVEEILGKDNVAELHTNRLEDKFEFVNYQYKSLLTAKDVPFDALSANHVENLKKMTGGDLMTVELKHSNKSFLCSGTFNILISGNGHLPISLGNTRAAFERRGLSLPCKRKEGLVRDNGLKTKILDNEKEGILAWAIRGAEILLNADGIMQQGSDQKTLNAMLMDESEPVKTFIQEIVEENVSAKNGKGFVTSEDMIQKFYEFAVYKGWSNYPDRDKKVSRDIRKFMMILHPKCHHSTNCFADESTKKKCRGYLNCYLKPIENE